MNTNEAPPRIESAHDTLVARYRDANTALDETPHPRVRAAVLAEANRIAREQRAPKPLDAFATKRAANDGQWRFAAAASVMMAGLAVFIVNQWESGEAELIVAQQSSVTNAPVATAEKAADAAQIVNAPIVGADIVGAVAADSMTNAASPRETTPPRKAPPSVTTERADAPVANVEKIERSASLRATTTPSASAAGTDVNATSVATQSSRRAANDPMPPQAPAATSRTEAFAQSAAKPEVRGERAAIAIPAAPAAAAAAAPPAPAAAAAMPRDAVRERKRVLSGSAAPEATAQLATASAEASRNVAQIKPDVAHSVAAMAATVSLRDAVRANDLATVRSAIRQQADVNAIDGNGRSFVALAVRSGNVELVVELMRAGADLDRRDNAGLSARDYAERSGNRAIIEVITK